MRRIRVVVTALLLALTASHFPARAAVSGANGRISFVRFRHGMLRTIKADGSGGRKVRRVYVVLVGDCPAWSPDGDRFAYVGGYGSEIWVMRSDGTHRHLVFNGSNDVSGPDWSPDGRRLVFATVVDTMDIFTIRLDGTGKKRLTKNFRQDYGPSWSPDGKRIAFHSGAQSHQTAAQIFTVRTDGTGLKQLTHRKTTAAAWTPDWSPDGTKIVFERDTKRYTEIFSMHRNGTHLKRLTHSSGVDSNPSWSPEGDKIVWYGDSGIFVMDADGSRVSGPLTSRDDRCPDWGSRS